MSVKPVEIFVILLAFVIAFVLLRVFKRDTLADKKRQDIEMKRAAIIAKRKAAAQAENNPDASMDDN
jgi:positive regulator of sigma E activity